MIRLSSFLLKTLEQIIGKSVESALHDVAGCRKFKIIPWPCSLILKGLLIIKNISY